MEINVNRFVQLLLAENEKQNLISRKAGPDEIDRHITDSLKILEFINLNQLRIVDIGSGAGFPGLILAMQCPEASFTLVEADLKKSSFLKTVEETLGLKNITILNDRVEVIGQDQIYREGYDLCTNRAVAAMNVMLEYSIPLIKPGGRVLMWKGRNYRHEIDAASHALDILGSEVEQIFSYNLVEDKDRVIVVVRKSRETPAKYPRRTGIPAKRPL